MNVAHVHAVFRAVVCRYCDRPIRLTSPFIKREMAIKHDDTKLNNCVQGYSLNAAETAPKRGFTAWIRSVSFP
jgi:hypothetical protein